MQSMGFNDKWIKRINRCISRCSFYVLINVESEGFFKSSRGLRQRDPISPFRFTLVMDMLNIMMRRAEERGLIRGLSVVEGGDRISYLQFVDDTYLFSVV